MTRIVKQLENRQINGFTAASLPALLCNKPGAETDSKLAEMMLRPFYWGVWARNAEAWTRLVNGVLLGNF